VAGPAGRGLDPAVARAAGGAALTGRLDILALKGLRPEVAQVWGKVRLVPLIRDAVRGDLRIGLRGYDAPDAVVDLGGRPDAPNATTYTSYVPHGLVIGWTEDGADVAGETLIDDRAGRRPRHTPRPFRVHHRMIARERRGAHSRLRLLPLHVAMEAFLALYFGGPEIAWDTYAQRVLRRGLTPRVEWTTPGYALPDLHAALRLFEIHEGQCGVLIFVGGHFAGASVVSHPADYRRLHRALIDDFYGKMLAWAAWYATDAPSAPVRIDGAGVDDWNGLAAALRAARDAWAGFEAGLAQGLTQRAVRSERAYAMGPFELLRFDTGFEPGRVNHIGEAIVRNDGTVEYLKTYRLSEDQSRRGFLLRHLALHRWHLPTAAEALQQTVAQLTRALKRAELGWMLRPDIRP